MKAERLMRDGCLNPNSRRKCTAKYGADETKVKSIRRIKNGRAWDFYHFHFEFQMWSWGADEKYRA